MPLMRPYMLDKLIAVLDGLVTSYATKTAFVLTQEEFIQCFVDPKHRPLLDEVEKLVGVATPSDSFRFTHHLTDDLLLERDGTRIPVVMSIGCKWPGSQPILVPKYAAGGLQPTAPEDLVARIRTWAMDRRRVGTAAGVGAAALVYLNQTCGNAKAAAVMFPAYTTLMARIEDNDKQGNSTGVSLNRAQRVNDTKSIGALPALKPAVRRAIYESSQVINALTLVSDAMDAQVPRKGAFLWMQSATLDPDLTRNFTEELGTTLNFR